MKRFWFLLFISPEFLFINLYAQVPFEYVIIDSANSSSAKPYGKAVGDLNNDNFPDLFISSAKDGGMHWYLYPDWKKQVVYDTGSWSEDCQIFDIDADGDNDIINGNKQGLYWYENPVVSVGKLDSNKWEEHYIGSDGTNIHDLEIADLNGDDNLDVVIRYEKENRKPVYIFLQEKLGEWTIITKTNLTNKKGEGLALGDLDKDGDVDIVLGNIWLENKMKGTVWQEHIYAENMPEQVLLKIADLDKNGIVDIIVSPQSTQSGKLAWYSKDNNMSDTLWVEHVIDTNVSRIHGLGIADFNMDGYLDIHTSIRHDHPGNKDNVSIWLSDGNRTPLFTEQILDINGSHFSKLGDIDNDGDIDIFGANWSAPDNFHVDIKLWRNLIKK